MAELYLGFRFAVVFLTGSGNSIELNPIDIRFQKVSGIKATLSIQDQAEGGQNLYTQKLPERIKYENLVLERGMVVGSPLHLELENAMTQLKLVPSNVVVMLLSEDGTPVIAWLFLQAYPVSWAISGFDAGQKGLVIETMELGYKQMQLLRF